MEKISLTDRVRNKEVFT